MAEKRELPFEDVSELTDTSPNAKVQGVLTRLSPMKKTSTCSYFDGQLSDGNTAVRVFGFDAGVRRKLLDFEERKQGITLSNCEIKRSRRGNELEILVNKRTEIAESEKVFKVEGETNAGKKSCLKELLGLSLFQRVTIEVKVVRVEKALEVNGGKKKQDILVGDETGTVRVTVWEEEIGKVKQDDSYRMSGMMVREFRGCRFLSTSKEGSRIEAIADIGDVKEESVEDEREYQSNQPLQLTNARVVGVHYLDQYTSCLKCTAKVLPDQEDPELGICSKCQMLQVMDTCKVQSSAQVLMRAGDSNGTSMLRAFGKVVEEITECSASEVTKRKLIKARPFDCSYQDGVILSIMRSV